MASSRSDAKAAKSKRLPSRKREGLGEGQAGRNINIPVFAGGFLLPRLRYSP